MPHEPESIRDIRRAQIIAAARRIIAEQGFEALTFSSLERALSFTRGAITWHFRDKDEILAAVLRDAIDAIDRAAHENIKAESDLLSRARAVIREMTRGWLSSDAGRALVSFWGRMASDPEAMALNAALYRRYRAYSSDLVRIGQQRGELSARVDPDAVGVIIVGVVQGIALQALFDPDAIAVDAAIDAAGDAIVALLSR